MIKARYVIFDGLDGSGKTTQMMLLEKKFGSLVIFTREPGGTLLAGKIRGILLGDSFGSQMTSLTRFLLFWAAREELQQRVVVPALRSGKHVFSDRGDSSTFAFQLYAEGHQELIDTFFWMGKAGVREGSRRRPPDLYVILDLPAEVALKRAKQRRTTNHFDRQMFEYHEKVRDGFHKFAEYAPVEFVDASQTSEEIHHGILKILARRVAIS